jgi:hypothetical protein
MRPISVDGRNRMRGIRNTLEGHQLHRSFASALTTQTAGTMTSRSSHIYPAMSRLGVLPGRLPKPPDSKRDPEGRNHT